ncbi:MAG: type II toxin-antitoxin system RelB/DinJ family antitoxin [Steroidobacteraceae bacterium]
MKRKDSVVRARIDSDLKAQAAKVLSGCGLELSDAIRLFLQQVVLQEAIPFPIEAIHRVERLPAGELWAMKAAAQARDQAHAHNARPDLSGESRLLVRSSMIRGARVHGWPSGRGK